jgi:4'-phosphopantetheinyl transferase
VTPEAFRLDGDIHLWLVDLVADAQAVAHAYSLLAEDEQSRALRFRTEDVRRRFVLARGVLRVLLGHHLQTSPAQVAFVYGAHGKPALAPPAPDLRFNLAHSRDRAAYVFTVGSEIGVDIEHTRAIDGPAIARHYFSPSERAALEGLAPADQPAAFFRTWVRKEAYVKARGGGLTIPLRTVDLESETTTADPRWVIEGFEAGDEYHAAFAHLAPARPCRWRRESADALLLASRAWC